MEKTGLFTKEQLVRLWGNSDKRKEFVKNYKVWGVFARTPKLGLTYYQYTLPDGARIIVTEYQSSYRSKGVGTTLHLLKKADEHFTPYSTNDWQINEHLKDLKIKLQAELKSA